MIEAFHQAKPDRVTGCLEYDWNRGPGGFDGQRTRRCGRRDDRDLSVNEVRRETRQPVKPTTGPAIFDGDVPTVNVTGLLQSRLECGLKIRAIISHSDVEETDNEPGWLLRTRDNRKQRGNAESSDQFASTHLPPRSETLAHFSAYHDNEHIVCDITAVSLVPANLEAHPIAISGALPRLPELPD